MTIPELERVVDDDCLHELDEGRLIGRPFGGEQHGSTGAEITGILGDFVKRSGLGKVYASGTGFVLGIDTVRAPDIAFVRRERAVRRRAFVQGAPDLAVEVFSPSDSVAQLMRKVHQYLKAGCHTVWVVYPESKQVHVLEASGHDRILEADEQLEAPELLPGFSVTVASLFE
jgi:Uma2 family endonuclease